jgi:hypothetical protein
VGVRVQISARLIRWPSQCACCLRQANEQHNCSHTRVTGKRVIRHNTKSWAIPYCSKCLDHVHANGRAEGMSSAGATAALVGGILIGLASIAFGLCCLGPSIVVPQRPHDPNVNKAGIVLASIVSTLVGIAAIVGGIALNRRLAAEYRRKLKLARQKAKSLASTQCCTLAIAANYEGWHGTVHSFWFANSKFADAFISANSGKAWRS